MSNLMQLLNKSKTIDEKASAIFSELIGQYNHGEIKTETELLYKVFNALNDFYASIGKPTYKFRPAKGTPVSEHYNSMIKEAVADISSILAESDNLSDILDQSFTEIEVDRKMLQNKIKYIGKLLDKVKIAAQDSRNRLVFGDSFVNTKQMDTDMIKGIPASINITEGVLTLNKLQAEDYSSTCDVEILSDSNGFPGNTHVADILDGSLHFSGEDNLHINLKDIIDGNNDTWFEYEIFSVTNEVYEQTVGLGFNYKENVSWITEEGPLRLVIRLTLKQPKTCNWLSLSPFIPEHKGVKAPQISSIIISDGKGTVQNITSGKRSFDSDIIYIFQTQVCKTVTVVFEQPLSYDIDIGHFFFTEVSSSNENYFDTTESKGGRVDGPSPSIELLGLKYDSKAKKVVNPSYTEGSNFIDDAKVKKELFTFPSDTANIKAGKEILPASRYHIGIKGINISCYTFDQSSEYISTAYESDESIATVSLDVTEMIPRSYGEGEWIKYSISVDDGQNWYPIVPTFKSYAGKSVYYINSNTPVELRHPANGYIETGSDVYSLRLKIELSRPTGVNDVYTTPIVSGYNIKVTTGGKKK